MRADREHAETEGRPIEEAGRRDAEPVRDARAGDAGAFEALVRRHLKTAHRVAASKLADPHDAEDVCQEAFVTALEQLDACREPERFRAWLLTIVRNTAHNYREYEGRRRGPSLEDVEEPAGPADPARDAERREVGEALAEILASLTARQRRVVLLHDYEGWDHGEIAAELDISRGASRWHLHVARRALRERLAARGYQARLR